MLGRLCELARRFDPVPEYLAAACCAIGAAACEPKIDNGGDPMPQQPSPPSNGKQQQVQNPLTLVMPIKEGRADELIAAISGLTSTPANRVSAKLDELQSVHFARFVLLEDNTRLAVITSYDGDFRTYVMDFIDAIGWVFDTLLTFVDDWPAGQRVERYRDEFVEYVEGHDLRCIGSFYSAYPEVPVNDIVPLRPGVTA
jgi:hypothetical protein